MKKIFYFFLYVLIVSSCGQSAPPLTLAAPAPGSDITHWLDSLAQNQRFVHLPEGVFSLHRPIEINTAVHLQGVLGWRSSATVLHCPNGCFIINHSHTSPTGSTARGTVLENLKLIGKDTATAIRSNAKLAIKHTWIEKFSVGIALRATALKQNGNANNSYFQRVLVDLCDTAYVFAGNDVNNCTLVNCSADNSGLGVYDYSSLGNSFYSLHTNANDIAIETKPGGVTRSNFFGSYAEGGQDIFIQSPSAWYGGTIGNIALQWKGTGYIETAVSDGLKTWGSKRRIENNKYSLTLGNGNGNDQLMSFLLSGDTHPGWSLEESSTGGLSWMWRRQDAHKALELTTAKTTITANTGAALPGGEMVAHKGLYIGDGNYKAVRAAKIRASSDTMYVTGHPGDILFNSAPSPGEPSYWHRVAGRWIACNILN